MSHLRRLCARMFAAATRFSWIATGVALFITTALYNSLKRMSEPELAPGFWQRVLARTAHQYLRDVGIV